MLIKQKRLRAEYSKGINKRRRFIRKKVSKLNIRPKKIESSEVKDRIVLNIEGKSIGYFSGSDLRILSDSLVNIQNLIDKTYLYSESKKKMSKDDYANLKITVSHFREGSFEADILVKIKEVILPLAPLVLEHGGDILTAIKNVYDFLKIKINATKEGSELQINNSGDESQVVYAPNNQGTIIVNCPSYVPGLAEKLSNSIHEMTRNIDGEDFRKISLSTSDTDLELDLTDKETFKEQSFTSDETFIISANIRKADANRFTGNLVVIESNDVDVQEGEMYLFKSNDGVFNEVNFRDSFSSTRRFKCKKRINIGPSNNYNAKVKEVIITEIL